MKNSGVSFPSRARNRGVRGFFSLALTAMLLLFPATGHAAAGGLVENTRLAAEWLQRELPTPAVGDETTVLALLQGGYITPHQAYSQSYLAAVQQHVAQGTAATQSRAASARQAFVLVCMGVDIPVSMPVLLERLANPAELAAEGPEAMRWTLMLYGTLGVAPPDGMDPEALAVSFAGTANEDGGFGAGASNALETAAAIQALSAYDGNETTYNALLSAQFWMQQRAGTGTYYMDGAPSADATAQAIIAVSCLGYDPAYIGLESPSMIDALLVFQAEDGAFRPNPDSAADLELTALCTLALAAKTRYDLGQKTIFNLSGVALMNLDPISGAVSEGAPTSAMGAQAPAEGDAPREFWGLPGSTWLWILGGALGVLLFIIIIASLVSGRRKKKRRGKSHGEERTDANNRYIYRK